MRFIAPEPEHAEAFAGMMDELQAHLGDERGRFTAEVALADVIADDAPLSALIAVDGDRLLGLVMWHFAYETAFAARGGYVTDLYVREEARGRGLGRHLLAAAAREVAEDGGVYLWLTAYRDNDAARAFYRQLASVEEDGVVAYAFVDRFDALAAEGRTLLR